VTPNLTDFRQFPQGAFCSIQRTCNAHCTKEGAAAVTHQGLHKRCSECREPTQPMQPATRRIARSSARQDRASSGRRCHLDLNGVQSVLGFDLEHVHLKIKDTCVAGPAAGRRCRASHCRSTPTVMVRSVSGVPAPVVGRLAAQGSSTMRPPGRTADYPRRPMRGVLVAGRRPSAMRSPPAAEPHDVRRGRRALLS
jgi:hypothetical protein